MYSFFPQNSQHSANQDLARAHGLQIQTVQWEDCARNKNSCLGPSICDLTLIANNQRLPAIRKPNFSDLTADLLFDSISVTVGNELSDALLRQISLKDYFSNIRQSHLILPRDNVILGSAQACILPLASQSGEVEFCPEIYSYQSSHDDPAVLLIVASSQGTSTHLLTGRQQKLYFNRGGQSTKFLAKRLKQDRLERGVNLEGDLTGDETDRNMLLLIQVPLKQRSKPRSFLSYNGSGSVGLATSSPSYTLDVAGSAVMQSCRAKASCANIGMDHAMIRAGDQTYGKFDSVENRTLIRDERFPMRVTVQFYKITDDTTFRESDFVEIASKINKIYSTGNATSSLVTSYTDRKTEPDPSSLHPLNFTNQSRTPLFAGI